MEEDPCVPSDRSGGERKHRGEREGREEEGEKAYTIALGGYWIRNRGHTGYRRILLPTLTSLSPSLSSSPSLRAEIANHFLGWKTSRRCKVSTECIIRTTEQRATGCLVLTSPLPPPLPLCSGPITRLTEYEEERIYLSILCTSQDLFSS